MLKSILSVDVVVDIVWPFSLYGCDPSRTKIPSGNENAVLLKCRFGDTRLL